jgi:RimJ/RimL family protein N-acetyltransferase
MNTPKFIKNVGDRNIKSIEAADEYIRNKMLPQLNDLGYSNYSLIRKSDNSKIGTCGLYDREGMDGIDIGFALLPEYEGLGFAYESANRIKKAAFEEFEIEEIKAITSKENISSQRLIEKLGLEKAGTIKLPNEDEELLLYKIHKKDKP